MIRLVGQVVLIRLSWQLSRIFKTHLALRFDVANHMLLERKAIVMRDALDEQIETFNSLLPELRDTYGEVWALIVNRQLVGTFKEFANAARYVIEHQITERLLIRHTYQKLETAPFVHIEE